MSIGLGVILLLPIGIVHSRTTEASSFWRWAPWCLLMVEGILLVVLYLLPRPLRF